MAQVRARFRAPWDTMALVKRGLAGLAIVLISALLPLRTADAASIQPGDYMRDGDKGCTLGFVVTSGAETYFLTAAHCVTVPSEVTLSDGTVLGDAVAEGNAVDVPFNEADDWALVQVRPHLVPSVVPTIRGGGAPSGVAVAGETRLGDLIKHSGYGTPWDMTPLTREQRWGVLLTQDSARWMSIGLDTFGDSGGPVVHVGTGKALGLVSRVCFGTCTSVGPTIEGIFAQAASLGYPLVLRTT
jgi:hypothetical protein